jgi:hypothetical protein
MFAIFVNIIITYRKSLYIYIYKIKRKTVRTDGFGLLLLVWALTPSDTTLQQLPASRYSSALPVMVFDKFLLQEKKKKTKLNPFTIGNLKKTIPSNWDNNNKHVRAGRREI